MKTVAFVPIKLNNERFPGKNVMPFTNGDPLISYILKTLLEVENIDEKYVYCSSRDIIPYLPEGIRFLQRDPYYDLSTTPFNEVLTSFAELVEADVYVLSHATAQFMSAKSISLGVDKVTKENFDCALAVNKLQEFMWKDGQPFNYQVENIPRTQDLSPMYTETCGLYVYARDVILGKKRRIGDRPYLIEVSKIEACDINTRDDFIIADAIFQALFANKQ